MLRTLFCMLSAVAVLTAVPAFAAVVESGTAEFNNVGVAADKSEFGSVIYNKNNGPITITGTITDWTGGVNSSWAGLWSCINLTPTHYFNLSGTEVTGYAHLGDTTLGDTSHQKGLGALGMVFWEWSADSTMHAMLEGYVSQKSSEKSVPAASESYDFELVYDFDAKTMSFSFDGSDVVTKDYSAQFDAADTFLLQVFSTNNDPSNLTMGFDLSYEVDAAFTPGDANNDGKVDGSDVTILAGNWQTLTGASWGMGDFNADGKVDGSDVTILAGNWQAGVSTAASSVPEPSTIVLLLAGITSWFFVRRR